MLSMVSLCPLVSSRRKGPSLGPEISFGNDSSLDSFLLLVLSMLSMYLMYLIQYLEILPKGTPPYQIVLERLVNFFFFSHLVTILMMLIQSGLFVGPLGLGLWIIVKIRTERVKRILCQLERRSGGPLGVDNLVSNCHRRRALLALRGVSIRTLVFMLDSNRVFSWLLLASIVGQMPINGVVVMNLVRQHYPWPLQVAMVLFVLGQFMSLGFFHSMSARLSHFVHNPYKRVMAQSLLMKETIAQRKSIDHPDDDQARGQRKKQWFRATGSMACIRLANHVQAFHVDKVYGVSYGPYFGTACLATFFKVSL